MGFWKPKEIATLRRIYKNNSTSDVAMQMGRSYDSVKNKAFELGLRKTRKFLKEMYGRRS